MKSYHIFCIIFKAVTCSVLLVFQNLSTTFGARLYFSFIHSFIFSGFPYILYFVSFSFIMKVCLVNCLSFLAHDKILFRYFEFSTPAANYFSTLMEQKSVLYTQDNNKTFQNTLWQMRRRREQSGLRWYPVW